MEYKRMIAITGMPGLFELVSSKNDGAIVKSLEDKTVRFVSSRAHNFSHLESIEVYTTSENSNLVDLFKAMETSTETIPSDKDAAGIKAYFEKVYPELDFERVYSSDMKKMVKWFGILKTNGVELKLSEYEAEENEAAAEEPTPAPETPAAEEAPKKKTSKKKTEEAKATTEDLPTTEA